MSDFTFSVTSDVPGINHGFRIVRIGGHCRLTKDSAVEGWQTEVAYKTKLARPKGWTPGRRIRVSYAVWFKRAGRDADGIVKWLLDGVAQGLGVNDSIMLATAVSVETDKVNPRVEVNITNED